VSLLAGKSYSVLSRLAAFGCLTCLVLLRAGNASGAITPGAVWLDDRGQQIQAHGGGILKIRDTFFWFGEDRTQGLDPNKRYVSCYASKDLEHWTFRNQVLKLSDPENFGPGWLIERPKVFYNAATKKFVMYTHIDDGTYKLARVGIAISDTVDGDYRYLKSFRPLGLESRDIGQFIDDHGTAYIIFESRPTKGFVIARLSPDYLNVEEQMSLVHTPLEGGAVVHYKGIYYVIGSHLSGWNPNPNVYATAASLKGPWTEFKDIAPPAVKTYNSQSSMLLRIIGTKTTSVIFMADQWKPKELWDSRYVWMPLQIGGGQLLLPEPRPWMIDINTGETKY
jgi:hypothetical protein